MMIGIPIEARYFEAIGWSCLGVALVVMRIGLYRLRKRVPVVASVTAVEFAWGPVVNIGVGTSGGFWQILRVTFSCEGEIVTANARHPFRRLKVGEAIVVYHLKGRPEEAKPAAAYFQGAFWWSVAGLTSLLCAGAIMFGPYGR